MPSRYDTIAAFCARKADGLLHAVGRALSGPDAMIEDACSFAWSQLLVNDHVALDSRGFAWLYCVALREGYRLSAVARRAPAWGAATDLPLPAGNAATDNGAVVERRLLHAERVELVRQIKPRRRAIVALQAAGLTYVEIAELTNNSLRTVDRQLRLGRAELQRLIAESRNQHQDAQ